MQKVYIVTAFDYPHSGGLSTHVKMLTAGLTEVGQAVEVISLSDMPKTTKNWLVRGPSFVLNHLSHGSGMIWSHERRKAYLRSRLAKLEPGTVINCQDVFALNAAQGLPLKKVLTVHGYALYEAVSKGSIKNGSVPARYFHDEEKKAYKNADYIVTVDSRIKNYIQDLIDEDLAGAGKLKVQFNFIDPGIFPETEDKEYQERRSNLRASRGFKDNQFIILCPRRMTDKNGVLFPARAVNTMGQQKENIKLLYAGDGEDRPKLLKYISDQGLQKQIEWVGELTHEQIIDYYEMCDAVVIPSVSSANVEEATSIAALEAMGSGRPVIASAVGGLKELIVSGENGFLVPEKDPEAIARQIMTIKADPKMAREIGQAGRQTIKEKHSHIEAAKNFMAIYTKLFSQN